MLWDYSEIYNKTDSLSRHFDTMLIHNWNSIKDFQAILTWTYADCTDCFAEYYCNRANCFAIQLANVSQPFICFGVGLNNAEVHRYIRWHHTIHSGGVGKFNWKVLFDWG